MRPFRVNRNNQNNQKTMKTNQTPEKRNLLLNAREVSRVLRLPLSTVYEFAVKGKLSALKVGKHWRYAQGDIQTYLQGIHSDRWQAPESKKDKRKHPRLNSEIPAKLQGILSQNKNIQIEGLILNVSEDGILFDCMDPNFAIGDPVWLSFCLVESGKQSLILTGRIVHLVDSKSGYGIKLKHPSEFSREAVRSYVS